MTVNLPPAVAVAGLIQAQRNKQKLADWLARVVVQACRPSASTAAAEQRLGERLAIDLFVHVASRDAALLTKRWKLLYERCQLEPDLWTESKIARVDSEEAPVEVLRHLNPEALRERWPALVASVWLAG
jgi:hypothetical protein